MIEAIPSGRVADLRPLLEAYPFPPFGGYRRQFSEAAIRANFVAAVQNRLAAPGTHSLWSRSGESAEGLVTWTPLALESEMFGFTTANIDFLLAAGDYAAQRATKENLLKALFEHRGEGRPRHVAARVDARDYSSFHALEACGFRLIDGLITFSRDLRQAPWPAPDAGGYTIRPATAADLPGLVSLASSSFTLDRLHADPAVPTEAADRLHGIWVEQSLQSADNQVLAAADEQGVCGYSVFKVNDETQAHLGEPFGLWIIAATAERARGGGVAQAMCFAMFDWFHAHGVSFLEVGTQLANVAAARLFESCGYRVINTRLTFSKRLAGAA